ncbi:hypothetical protein [Lacticaseibacillus kribbianus]|nr:hypothetical protein [Lacticaseibacillus kribbianus]
MAQWATGAVATLPELDEPRLTLGTPNDRTVGRGLYADLVTVTKLSGV